MKENMNSVMTIKDRIAAIVLICAMFVGLYKILWNAFIGCVKVVTKCYSIYYKKKHGTDWDSYEIWKKEAKFEW